MFKHVLLQKEQEKFWFPKLYKKVQPFVTLLFIEITETNNTLNNLSWSLSVFHNSVLTKSTE